MTTGPEFERLESHLRGSWLLRAVGATASVWRAAAARSAIERSLRSANDRFRSLAEAERLRAIAVLVAAAAIVHLLLLRLVPLHIAPALPKTIWVLVALVSLVATILPERLVVGWESSFVSRLWRVTRSRRPTDL